jgi:hypothetical protein
MNQHIRVADLIQVASEPAADLRVPFSQVGAFACKFIIGDPDEHAVCCGAPTDGRSWCPYHRKLVFERRER